jgi:hypothetical protein
MTAPQHELEAADINLIYHFMVQGQHRYHAQFEIENVFLKADSTSASKSSPSVV